MKTTKSSKTDMPMSRKEFKDAISKLSREELIEIICDIYYANASSGQGKPMDDEHSCNCGCEPTPSKSAKTPKATQVKKSVKKK